MGQTDHAGPLSISGEQRQNSVSQKTRHRGIQGGALGGERRLMDIKEASHYIGLQVDTVYRMVSHRRIPFVKVGRRTLFDVRLLDNWLAEHTVLPLPRKVA